MAIRASVKTTLLAVTLACGCTDAAAQVLNMSHDLVSIGIASQNLTPNQPTLDAQPLMQAAFNYVQSHPVQTLTLDTGSYYLLTAHQSNAVLILAANNLTVDLAGSTIYFKGPELPNGLQLYYCNNVTVTNFQIDYIDTPYTHVTLTSVDTVNRLLKYQTLPGWPDPSTFNTLTNPFGGRPIEGYWAAIFRNGIMVPGTNRTLLLAPFSNSTLTIQDGFPWAQSATLSTLQSGDTVVVSTRGGGPPILVWEGNGITLSKISIYGSPTWAVDIFQTSNSTVDGVRVMPRPGVGLIGSDADGIHFSMTGPNNHIRNSYVARTMDDAIIMDNQFAGKVTSQAGPRQLTVTRNTYIRFPNGAPMNFVDLGTTLESAGATIVNQNPPDGPAPAFNGSVTLTFDQDLPALAPGTIMAFGTTSARAGGSTIEDNLVEDTYGGRGIWLSGVEGVTVQRNVIRRASDAAVNVESSTESVIDPGDEGPPAHNLTITDNSIEAPLGPVAAGGGLEGALGGIEVETTANPYFVLAAQPSNTNITIANNYIADSGRSGLWIGESNGVTLQNNLVVRYSQYPTLGGVAGIATQDQSKVMADAYIPVVLDSPSTTSIIEIGDTLAAASTISAPVTMAPASITLTSASASSTFSLQTAVTGFAWNAVSDSAWLTVTTSTPGAGSATIQYSVSANTSGAVRIGHITIAGETFTVTQLVPNTNGLQFVPVTPCRVADTRNPTGPFGGPSMGAGATRNFAIPASACGIPLTAQAYALNVTVVPHGPLGWLSMWPAGQSQPLVSTLNSFDGRIKANAAVVSAGANGAVSVYVTDLTDVIIDISGYFIPPSSTTLAFYPITPCRIADTRQATGTFGGPSMVPNVARDFPVLSSACSVPAGALAYSLNMTVVPSGPLGWLTTWPAGTAEPLVSTLNAPTGAITANAAIVPAGNNGAISALVTNTSDLIIDINGYFAPAGAGALSLYSVTPCRIADTRGAAGPFGAPQLSAGVARSFPVPSSSCGIPAGAKAYSLNATVVPPAALVYLTLFGNGPLPIVSTLNDLDTSIVANAAIVPVASDGSVSAYASNATQLILDVNGYFAP